MSLRYRITHENGSDIYPAFPEVVEYVREWAPIDLGEDGGKVVTMLDGGYEDEAVAFYFEHHPHEHMTVLISPKLHALCETTRVLHDSLSEHTEGHTSAAGIVGRRARLRVALQHFNGSEIDD